MSQQFTDYVVIWTFVFVITLLVVVFLPRRYCSGLVNGDETNSLPALMVVLTVIMALMGWGACYQQGAKFIPSVAQAYESLWLVGVEFVSVKVLVAYFGVGLVWTFVHFSIYARRLGQRYVTLRDSWLIENSVTMDTLTDKQKAAFSENVFPAVKSGMHFAGDFPLRPFQQKRFFCSNLLLWPVTVAFYLLEDLVVDVARAIWFAVRNRVYAYWAAGMTQYLADGQLCQAFQADMDASAAEQAKFKEKGKKA